VYGHVVRPPANSVSIPAHIARHDSLLEELVHELEVVENRFVCHSRNRIIILRWHANLGNGPLFHRGLWRAVHGNLISEQANLFIALDIHAFVFAQFGFADGEQGAVGSGPLHLPGDCMTLRWQVKGLLMLLLTLLTHIPLSRIHAVREREEERKDLKKQRRRVDEA
jgi:hypothetical protein